MKQLTGECVLIFDGQLFEGCSCAFEKGGVSARAFGLLSAPSEVLAKARTGQRVKIAFRDHPTFEATLLTINSGIALFSAEATCIRVTLSSGGFISVVEGKDVREVCIRAEEQLWENGSADGAIEYEVLSADREEAAAIGAYLTSLQLPLIDLQDMPIAPGIVHTLELVRLDNSIRRAEERVCKQRHRVETIAHRGWSDNLSTRVLDTLTMSLALLNKHRDIIRHELMHI